MLQMSEEDITRTWGNTYLGIRKDNSIQPLLVHRGCSYNTMLAEVVGEGTLNEIDINSPDLVMTFPDSGAYNIPEYNQAVYVARRAEKQYHRGVRANALVISGSTTRFSADLVQAMYNPSYVGYAEALEIVRKKGERVGDGYTNSGAAINHNFWLSSSHSYKNVVILFRSKIIGEIKEDGTVSISSKMHKELFEEAVNENP